MENRTSAILAQVWPPEMQDFSCEAEIRSGETTRNFLRRKGIRWLLQASCYWSLLVEVRRRDGTGYVPRAVVTKGGPDNGTLIERLLSRTENPITSLWAGHNKSTFCEVVHLIKPRGGLKPRRLLVREEHSYGTSKNKKKIKEADQLLPKPASPR